MNQSIALKDPKMAQKKVLQKVPEIAFISFFSVLMVFLKHLLKCNKIEEKNYEWYIETNFHFQYIIKQNSESPCVIPEKWSQTGPIMVPTMVHQKRPLGKVPLLDP